VSKQVLTNTQYLAFLKLMMCSDPWPVHDGQGEKEMEAFADQEAKSRGYNNWIEAYQEFRIAELTATMSEED